MTDPLETPSCLAVRSWAKINLTLDVFSKRSDGYHAVASVMQAISLHDTLHITRREKPGVGFTCDAPEAFRIPVDATNLVVRAAQAALASAAEVERCVEGGVAIHLTKRIPAQAGLGGGSSNGAAALRGVDALLGLELDSTTLHTLAASLGSDVPFFLTGGTASARGRGEAITPLPDVPTHWVVIVKPEENVSTGWAYGELDSIPERSSHRATKRMEEAIKASDWERLIAWQCNDFELPVFANLQSIAWLHDELLMAGAQTAHLCGSGSAVYGMMESAVAAERVAALLRRKYAAVSIARTLAQAECDPLSSVAL